MPYRYQRGLENFQIFKVYPWKNFNAVYKFAFPKRTFRKSKYTNIIEYIKIRAFLFPGTKWLQTHPNQKHAELQWFLLFWLLLQPSDCHNRFWKFWHFTRSALLTIEKYVYLCIASADMVELVDTIDLGSIASGVGVRVSLSAQRDRVRDFGLCFFISIW